MKRTETVLIVGSGPVGLMAACELVRRGVPCRIIDQSSGPSQYSKAFAVHARSLEVFDSLGIADELLARGVQVRKMHFYHRAERAISVDFNEMSTRFPFVLSVPQSDTEMVLRELLSSMGSEVEQNTKLTTLVNHPDCVEAVLLHENGEEEIVYAEWLIGADGAHSTVRKELKIGWRGANYDIDFLVADGKLTSGKEDADGHTYITDAGYVMVFPLPYGAHRVVLDLSKQEKLDRMPQVEDVNNMLLERGLSHLKFQDPFWLSSAHIRRMLAETYMKGRVFLAGDAAHVHSPVGGQGLNTGIQDAHNLAWKLAMVINGQASDHFLASYEIERRSVAADVLSRTDSMTRMFTDRNPLRRMIRTKLLPFVASFPSVRRKLSAQASGLSVKYSSSPAIASQSSYKKGILLGKRAIDVQLVGGQDQSPVQLSDEFRGKNYTLLLCLGHNQSNGTFPEMNHALTVLTEFGELIKPLYITLSQWPDAPQNLRHFVDVHGHAHASYTGGKPGICVVRPDGYVAFSSDIKDWYGLTLFFKSHLVPVT